MFKLCELTSFLFLFFYFHRRIFFCFCFMFSWALNFVIIYVIKDEYISLELPSHVFLLLHMTLTFPASYELTRKDLYCMYVCMHAIHIVLYVCVHAWMHVNIFGRLGSYFALGWLRACITKNTHLQGVSQFPFL